MWIFSLKHHSYKLQRMATQAFIRQSSKQIKIPKNPDVLEKGKSIY